MRRSPRRLVTPVASSCASSGKTCLRVAPKASRTAATVTPSGEAASRPAIIRAAPSIASAAKYTPSRSMTSPRRTSSRTTGRATPADAGSGRVPRAPPAADPAMGVRITPGLRWRPRRAPPARLGPTPPRHCRSWWPVSPVAGRRGRPSRGRVGRPTPPARRWPTGPQPGRAGPRPNGRPWATFARPSNARVPSCRSSPVRPPPGRPSGTAAPFDAGQHRGDVEHLTAADGLGPPALAQHISVARHERELRRQVEQ